MDNINNFDFPSWTDIKNKTTELLGKATGNTAAVVNAQIAQKANDAMKAAGVNSQVTAQDVVKSTNPIIAEEQRKAISESVTEGITSLPGRLLGEFKWLLIIVFVVILIAVFFRVSGK